MHDIVRRTINKDLFSKGKEEGYLCELCDREVGLSDSYSKRGDRLICSCCFYKLQRILGLSTIDIINRLHREE